MKIAVTNPTDSSDACELQFYAESDADSVLLARLDRQYELVGMGRDAESGLVMHARVRLVAKGSGTIGDARDLLTKAGIFFGVDDEDDDPKSAQTINLNDAMYWACSDCEYVPDDKLIEVARLFYHYGWCGILYWVSEQRQQERAEFVDVNRFVEFVRNEEKIRSEVPSSSKRAYAKRTYTIVVDCDVQFGSRQSRERHVGEASDEGE